MRRFFPISIDESSPYQCFWLGLCRQRYRGGARGAGAFGHWLRCLGPQGRSDQRRQGPHRGTRSRRTVAGPAERGPGPGDGRRRGGGARFGDFDRLRRHPVGPLGGARSPIRRSGLSAALRSDPGEGHAACRGLPRTAFTGWRIRQASSSSPNFFARGALSPIFANRVFPSSECSSPAKRPRRCL